MEHISLCTLSDAPHLREKNRPAFVLRRAFILQYNLGLYSGRIPSADHAELMVEVLRISRRPVKLKEILERLGGMSRSYVVRRIITPLTDMCLLGMTHPITPRSCKQRYVASLSATVYLS